MSTGEVVMTRLEDWLDPLSPGDVEFRESVGKTVARARFCRDETDGDFLEFQFTDGTVFRIDPRAHLKVQFMDVDSDRELDEVTDYGVLGESPREPSDAIPE
jgi:hypothetical protein